MTSVQRFPRGRFNTFHNVFGVWQVGLFLLVALIPALYQVGSLSVEEVWPGEGLGWLYLGLTLGVIPMSVILYMSSYWLTHSKNVVWEFKGQTHDFRTFLIVFLIGGVLLGLVWGFLFTPGMGIVGSFTSMYLFLSFYWNGGIWYHFSRLARLFPYSRFQDSVCRFLDSLVGETTKNLPNCMIWTVFCNCLVYAVAIYGIHS